MITKRKRDFATSRESVWKVVGDGHHEPRWWPMVDRVERVNKRGWTSVSISSRGTTVRSDWTVEANEEPTRRRWSQDLAGTPFEKVLKYNAREILLEKTDTGTRVTLIFDQQIRGMARFVPIMFKNAMKRQIDEALEGLAYALGEAD